MRTFLLLCFLSFGSLIVAHEGHEEKRIPTSESYHDKVDKITDNDRLKTWSQWIGSFHLILLHFPITLINMLVISEILFAFFRRQIFESSSQFLGISAAILSPPTALLGFIYSYSASYEGLMKTFLFWHMWLGFLTAIFAVIIVLLREKVGIGKLYYGCLFLLFLIVNIGSFFGGCITFGTHHMFSPF